MFVKKFYDPAVQETAVAPRFEVGEAIDFNDIINQKPEETPAEIAPEEVKAPVIEEVKKVEEKIEPPVIEAAKPEVVTPDWKEFVKNPEHRKEVHSLLDIDEDTLSLSKEIKEDEFVKKLIAYRKEHGNVTPFIEAATKDWDKYSHLELLRDELKKQYPSLTKEKFEVLAKNQVDKRFILGDDADPEEAELASILLETEGEKIRQARKQEQTTFLDSVKPAEKKVEAPAIQSPDNAAELEQFRQAYEKSPFTQKLITEKKIALGSKTSAFNYAVNPDVIKEQTLDTNKFYGQFWEGDKFDEAKWSKVSAYAQNPDGFEEALINHGRSLGTKQIVEEELENTKEHSDNTTQIKAKSLAKTFATEGQATTLDQMMI
jgi:hypothetical protein